MGIATINLNYLEGENNSCFFHHIKDAQILEQYLIKKTEKLPLSERKKYEAANKFAGDNDIETLIFDSGVIAVDKFSFSHNWSKLYTYFEHLAFFKIVKCYVVERESLSSFIKNNVTRLKSSNVRISENETSKQFNGLTLFGYKLRASDIFIHLSSKNDQAYVTYKVEGELHREVYDLKNYKLGRAIVSSIYNTKSGTGAQVGSYDDVTSPQRKNINHTIYDELGNPIADMEYRFTKTVTQGPGEILVVMRAQGTPKRLIDLGLGDEQRIGFHQVISSIAKNGGVSIISGKTGSGKSTTNYACLLELPRSCVVQTFEDPIEFTKPPEYKNITQVALNKSIGYQNQLGAIMQQAPDVLFLQEIRDQATANFGIGIANTGHGLVTSLHAKSPFGIIERLSDLCGPEIRASLSNPGILKALSHQALVPQLCPHCSLTKGELSSEQLEKFLPTLTELRLKTSKTIRFRNSKGCSSCRSNKLPGEDGRVAVLETLFIQPSDLQFIAEGNLDDWRNYRVKKGHKTLKARAFDLLKEGRICLTRYTEMSDE